MIHWSRSSVFFLDKLSVVVVELLDQIVDVTHHISEQEHANELSQWKVLNQLSNKRYITSTAML